MATIRLWPTGFTSRVTLLLLAAIFVQFAIGGYLVGLGERHIQQEDLARRIAEQLLVAERIIEAAPPTQRARLVSDLSTRHLVFSLRADRPQLVDTDHPLVGEVRAEITRWEPALSGYEIALGVRTGPQLRITRVLEGALKVPGGPWIYFRTMEPLWGWAAILSTLLSVGLVAAVVLLVAALLVGTMGAPLRRLARNARLIGTSGRVHFEERGPRELRRVARALNDMQARIEALIAERTTALAAVGHDLRTPLARLNLRLRDITDPAERDAARRDIAEMNHMLEGLLDYLNGNESEEAPVVTDVVSLLETIVEEVRDLGGTAHYAGPQKLVAPIYYSALKRAVTNLVDNAVKYGGSAAVSARIAHDRLFVDVEDKGPGLAEDALERVRQPFVREDSARSGEHHGFGLGLSIAEGAAKKHGGELLLRNRPNGGLLASLKLPICK